MMNNSQGASSFFSGLSTLLGRPHPLLHNLSDTTEVTLRWNALTDYNIINYEYRQNSGSWGSWQTISPDVTSHKVTGLTNGIAYSFQVRANNSIGEGDDGATVSATPKGPPAAPDLAADAQPGKVRLYWTNPGDPSITEYQARWKESNGEFPLWADIPNSDATTTSYEVDNLTNGTGYTFEVRAVSDAGDGAAASVTSTPQSGEAEPGGLTGVTATVTGVTGGTGGTVEFSWDDPGDASIDKYEYRYSETSNVNGFGSWTDTTTTTSAGKLSFSISIPGSEATVFFELRAVHTTKADDPDLRGPAAAVEVKRENPTGTSDPPPAEPTALTTNVTTGQVVLGWKDPSNTEIIKYQVRQSTDGGTRFNAWADISGDGATTSHTVDSLTDGTTYVFEVRAVAGTNDAPVYGAAAQFDAVTPGAPDPPTDLSVAAVLDNDQTLENNEAQSQLKLSWIAPSAGVTPTSYQYRQRADGAGVWENWANNGTMTEHTVTELVAGTTYEFQVRSMDGTIPSVASISTTGTTATDPVAMAPAAPTDLRAGPSDGQVTLSWNNPSDLTILRYRYRAAAAGAIIDDANWEQIPGSTRVTTSYVVGGLDNGIEYTFQVQAVGSGGLTSEASSVITATPTPVVLMLSYQEESYTALEGGEAATVTVKLSFGWGKELAIPIRVTRSQPESTEVDDYTVDGLEEWDAQEGTGKLTFSAGETKQTFTIAANDDGDGEDEELELGFGDLPTPVMARDPVVATVTLEDKGLGLVLSYQEESYTALEGGEAATVTVKLSFGWGEELAIPIRVTRSQPESTEVDDYTVDGLEEWDAQEGTGKLTFSAGETKQTFTIAANDDGDGEDEELELGFGDLPTPVMARDPVVATVTLEDKGLGLVLSYQEESYTALEGGEAATVTVKLSFGWGEELAIPIRVTRSQPESTEVDDYTVDGLEEWDAQEGTGKLTFSAGETKQTFTIAANDDGDGEDEELELGFGDLPTPVMAGDPVVATVTLEDKGLVELTVSFGQAEYEIREGQEADIEVEVSPAADRRVEVPLVVALQGGATDADYSVVPAKVVFEEGESQGTISLKVLADEVDDPGESIVLSFGELPEAVTEGEISQTIVNFTQRRTAEQFSQTLEVMLAVLARSTAASAQSAIQGRFERHRQWSRLGSSGAMQGSGTNEVARVDVVEPTQGSWLRSFSLGSLGSAARSGQSYLGASSGYSIGPSGSVDEHDRLQGFGIGDASLGSGLTEYSGMRDQGFNLAGTSFEMPLPSLPTYVRHGARKELE